MGILLLCSNGKKQLGISNYSSDWFGFIAGIGAAIGGQVLAVGAVALWCRQYLYEFLAPNHPLETTVLIVEGWIPDRVMKQVASIMEEGHYGHVLISGLPLHKGAFLTQYNTYAEVTADTLVALGINRDCITVINCEHTYYYRTRTAAQAIYDWVTDQGWQLSAINLCTAGAHARRSWLTYRRIFAPRTDIGIIALPDGAYEPSSWWRSSAGFRVLIGEAIAYLYARWFE